MKDIIIIGGGVAGLTAGMYAKRAGLDVVLFEKMFAGGQVVTTSEVENYPGIEKTLTGPEIASKFADQAMKFEVDIQYDEVTALYLNGKVKKVETLSGTYEAKTVILATGASPRPLYLDREDELKGKGISYCATCDGAFFKNKVVAVVGGGDTAVEDALVLSQYASRVYLIHRRNELRAEKIMQKRIMENPKIDIVWDSVITKFNGEDRLESVTIENVKSKKRIDIEIDGLFVAIGVMPVNSFFKDLVEIDKGGFVITDQDMNTSIDGVYAAGDIRKKSLLQLITAAADGATAAFAANKYIIENFE